jgi:hypothetical protein
VTTSSAPCRSFKAGGKRIPVSNECRAPGIRQRVCSRAEKAPSEVILCVSSPARATDRAFGPASGASSGEVLSDIEGEHGLGVRVRRVALAMRRRSLQFRAELIEVGSDAAVPIVASGASSTDALRERNSGRAVGPPSSARISRISAAANRERGYFRVMSRCSFPETLSEPRPTGTANEHPPRQQ